MPECCKLNSKDKKPPRPASPPLCPELVSKGIQSRNSKETSKKHSSCKCKAKRKIDVNKHDFDDNAAIKITDCRNMKQYCKCSVNKTKLKRDLNCDKRTSQISCDAADDLKKGTGKKPMKLTIEYPPAGFNSAKKKSCEHMEVSRDPYRDVVDMQEVRKLASDLTEVTSGFKFRIFRKLLPHEIEEINDAIVFYENFPDDEEISDKKKSKKSQCECKKEDTPEYVEESEPSKHRMTEGIKLHVSGKGSGSKGLTGVCCFDMKHQSEVRLLESTRSSFF